MAYFKLLESNPDFLLGIDVATVSLDLLCHLLERNVTAWREKDLYDLCSRSATTHCEANATPEELRNALGKARYLIRHTKMVPSEIDDGPFKDMVLSSNEVTLVYNKILLGSSMAEHYPFSEGKRQLFEYRILGGTSYQVRSTDNTVDLPIKVTLKGRSFIDTSLSIEFRPEMSEETCRSFSRLCECKLPFELIIDGKSVTKKFVPYIQTEEKDPLCAILRQPRPSGPAYVTAGDVALACSFDHTDVYLELHVAVRSGFQPSGWIVVGRLGREHELELLKGIRRMKTVNVDYFYDLTVTANV